MSTRKYVEEIRSCAVKAGVHIDDLKMGGKHWKARVSSPDGRRGIVVIAVSPGDAKNLSNTVTAMRNVGR